MLELLVLALWVGLSAAGGTVLLRSWPPPLARWTEAGVKPLACDVCMSFWTTVAACLLLWAFGTVERLQVFFVWAPSYAVAMAVLRHLTDPVGLPPLPVDSGDDDES